MAIKNEILTMGKGLLLKLMTVESRFFLPVAKAILRIQQRQASFIILI